jgi:hypothetical protein
MTAICLALAFTFIGCGGKKLIPRDVKDFMAETYKTDRRNFDVNIPFRTTIIRRIPAVPIVQAREEQRDFIRKFFEYCRRDAVVDFENDSLLFYLRLDTSPDIYIKWNSSADDARKVLDGTSSEDMFFDGCLKEERWAEELG